MPGDKKISELTAATSVAIGDTSEIVQGGINKKTTKENYLAGALYYKGTIALAADFPTAAGVKVGWLYSITAAVTDNDPTKTNTGQSFKIGDLIFWNGVNYTVANQEQPEEADALTVDTDGQTSFTLSKTALAPALATAKALVNGVEYEYATHFTISGTTLTWVSTLISLKTTDKFIVRYFA